jgi:hypothetical protein
MNRHIVMLVSAGAIIVGLSNPILAQGPQTSDPNTAVQPSTTAPPPSAARGAMKAERKACRAQGKQQSLTHAALRNYVKSCLAAR